jgi:hypothetical protein
VDDKERYPSAARRQAIIRDNILYHALSRPRDDRKKNAAAIEFCELGGALSRYSSNGLTPPLATHEN